MTIDTDKLATLRALAEKATPGPWRVDTDDTLGETRVTGIYGPSRKVDYGLGAEDESPQIVETDSGVYPPKLADAQFIAAASPDVVIALLDSHANWEGIARERHETLEWVRRELGEARQHLSAVTAARDELADIAANLNGDPSDCRYDPMDGERIAELRKVGQ
jgi:hypothetical protein